MIPGNSNPLADQGGNFQAADCPADVGLCLEIKRRCCVRVSVYVYSREYSVRVANCHNELGDGTSARITLR